MKKIFYIICLFVFFNIIIYNNAKASPCYTLEEAKAEQAVRIQSELMVIGLNCQHMYSAYGMNLYDAYKLFVRDHVGLFKAAEKTLISFYGRYGVDNPEFSFRDLQTHYANKVSADVAAMRPDAFCHHYAPRIEKARGMSRSAVEEWAGTFFNAHPVTYPVCR